LAHIVETRVVPRDAELQETAEDLRTAMDRHPIERLLVAIPDLLLDVRLPIQYPAGQRFA
jgi:hypothetical protein